MLKLRHGIYFIIFSMPLYLCRFSVFGIPTNILEIMVFILFILWIFKKIKRINSFQVLTDNLNGFIHSTKNNFVLNIGIVLLFIGVIISTTISSDIMTSLGIFKGWFVSPFLFFIVFVKLISKKEHILWSIKSWFASGAIISFIGIFYILTDNLTFDGRLRAFFLSPNYLAMYLSPAVLIGIFFLLNKKKIPNINHRLLKIIFIIILITLYFTHSYGAFLGIFSGIIYLLSAQSQNSREGKSILAFQKKNILFFLHSFIRWLRNFSLTSFQISQSKTQNSQLKLSRKHILKFISDKLFISLLFIVFIGFIFISLDKFNQIANSKNRSSFHSRLMIWNSANEIIKDNLLFGIGPGTFQETYLSYSKKFSKPYLEWAVPQPHNIFLAFYLQTGFIGFIGFILILFWFYRRKDITSENIGKDTINRASITRSNHTIAMIINSLMIYTLVHGLVDTTYWKNDLALMFWIIIGLGFLNNKILSNNDEKENNFI